MISFITGLPGAGKTSWLVQQVLVPLDKKDYTEDAIDDQGVSVKIKRRILTNIKGLLMPHELIGDDELNTWHEWAKPGDLIIFDEVQKPWPKVPSGTKKPKCISELETHRHYGVDFWLLTQNTNLVNDAPVTLAGQHKHVRKVANSRYATVYEWDGVSKTLNYKNSMTKSPWRRSKDTEKLYRSSALHTKQKRAIPTVAIVFAFALVALPAGGYLYSQKFKAQFFAEGKPAVVSAASSASAPGGFASLSVPAAVADPAPLFEPEKPKVMGCVSKAQRCECYDEGGHWIDTDLQACMQTASRGGVLVPYQVSSPFVAAIKDVPSPDEPEEVAGVMSAFAAGHISR